jgi:hypothetical protein
MLERLKNATKKPCKILPYSMPRILRLKNATKKPAKYYPTVCPEF